MSMTGKHIVIQFTKRWQFLLVVEVCAYALGFALLVFAVSFNLMATMCGFVVCGLVLLLIRKPWQINLNKASSFLDQSLGGMENSTGLFLTPKTELSDIALLQRHRIEERLKTEIGKVEPKVPLKRALLWLLVFGVAAFFLYYFNLFGNLNTSNNSPATKEAIVFQALDSVVSESNPPSIKEQRLTIKYPAYTGLPPKTTTNMNIKALEGSTIFWSIQFDKVVDSVFMERNGESNSMKLKGTKYIKSIQLAQSGFYNFKFKDLGGTNYLSDLYSIEVVKDEIPEIEIQQLKQFSSFDAKDDKILNFNTLISDDYGISDVYIIATVTKGEGESVKFREERLSFGALNSRSKKLNLKKTIDLAALKMEAGDELYFYIEAIDTKQPKPNRARSETFFAVIRDTVSNRFAVEGTMGVDLMPDYFRSQRQLIIDTEKLIADKNKLTEKEFNFTSNELGYDQKALRLKYGEFMGDEADSGIQVTEEIEPEALPEGEQEEDDPLGAYTHDHDHDNEHNLADLDHEEEETDEEEDPLSNYLHNHDDPEESTLFTQSLKSKLRQAMAEMWDAELHLRLYTPENSLPYQYRALKLIQEIKNSSRIYVHRIGFDPPPIKEDKRLSGEIKDIKTLQKVDDVVKEDDFSAMREAVTRITEIVANQSKLVDTDRGLFDAAGNELAVLAIKNPSKYLNTLQRLKWISEKEQITVQELLEVQSGLLRALPTIEANPSKRTFFQDEMNTLMLKELEIND
ncbi:tryptophan-rich sensory protein [Maribacter algarum]|uniref:Tryptophan-rich sensory protein n=1 Tax=Maribacter algarum (ex Zhang et al. 2020) TaxID=2578118 RepID=A0A5S3PHN6_9FLAO|nr:tryptophan-rich sensory protein [Maribacter algarum]TMM53757.1 tryptophan-rich sensory protein [Maribacter algarum]